MPQTSQEQSRQQSSPSEIRRAIELIIRPTWERGGVAELRALGSRRGTVSGYFDAEHIDDFINAAHQWSGQADGVYVTLNPIIPDCLARAANRTALYARNTTNDAEVMHRHWLLIDADPKRPSGVSAADDEHELALRKAIDIRTWLYERGWPDPLYADSGNGGHLLYRIDLSTDDERLVQQVLKALDAEHSDETVAVDKSVHNAARISKLYGTLACKGDSIPDRPHRLARLLEVPENIVTVSMECLQSLASESVLKQASKPSDDSNDFDIVKYLESKGVEVGRSKPYGEGATLWELNQCPWRPDEGDGGPYVIRLPDGKIIAGCHHSQCEGKGWDDMRDVIDPGWRKGKRKASRKAPPVAKQIVALAVEDKLFHTSEKEAFVTVSDGSKRQTYPINSDSYRLVLRKRFHKRGLISSKSALDDAVKTLESRAIFDGPEYPVYVRTAEHDGKLYIDLCDDDCQVVELTESGWAVIVDTPVKFIRKPGMLALPMPAKGGRVADLRDFINVTDADWPLVVSWLMAALRPTGPYPILLVNGEQGSCKSTTCRRLRSLIDPHTVPLRDAPRDEQTLMIWAKNAHVIALDNLSEIPKNLSNAMCRLATGGGYSQRAHYTNDSEAMFYSVRPQIVNGIGDIATRSDLLDRSLSVCLPVVLKSKRKTEKQLNREFDKVHASIFGALLTAACHGIKCLPEVEKQNLELPRLADFGNWMVAVETALGWKQGAFMEALSRNESESHELAVTGSVVADVLRKFVGPRKQWEGGWTELLNELSDFADDSLKHREGWPRDARTLSNKLRELAPNLRGCGVDVEFCDKNRPKSLKLTDTRHFSHYGDGTEIVCYDNTPPTIANDAIYLELWRFWTASPVASVAAPSLDIDFCDGTEPVAV